MQTYRSATLNHWKAHLCPNLRIGNLCCWDNLSAVSFTVFNTPNSFCLSCSSTCMLRFNCIHDQQICDSKSVDLTFKIFYSTLYLHMCFVLLIVAVFLLYFKDRFHILSACVKLGFFFLLVCLFGCMQYKHAGGGDSTGSCINMPGTCWGGKKKHAAKCG